MAIVIFCCGLVFCCCSIILLPFCTGLLFTILSYFFSAFNGSETFTEGLWVFGEKIYYFSSYFFWKLSDLFFFLLYYFVFWVLPYAIVIAVCGKFHQFIYDKIQQLREKKREMITQTNAPSLEFYVNNLKIMRTILILIFGFLIALRFLTWLLFENSLIMEIITYINIGILMTFLLMKEDMMINTQTQQTFAYYFFLIVLGSYIIDDMFHMITGYKFLFL